MSEIKTPVQYEAISKTIYQCGGFGIVAKVDEFTHDEDDGIGSKQYDELCDSVGEQIVTALNTIESITAERDKLKREVEELKAVKR